MQPDQLSSSVELQSMIRLPGRIRWALGLFHEVTGLTAVMSLVTPLTRSGQPPALSPPVHPRCARRLRSVRTAPCREQWLAHVRSSRRSPSVRSHTCPLGLCCSCVPIHFAGDLMGVVKLVVGSETSDRRFSAATRVLKLIVSGVCQDSVVSVLSEEVGTLRRSAARFRETAANAAAAAIRSDPPVAGCEARAARRENLTLVDRTLSYLHTHYQAPTLSLPAVAELLGCNPRYLTTRFTLIVGARMHAYLVRLRVAHASQLLMESDVPIKEAAYLSGFRGNGALARAFRRHVGVSPGEYRRIFAAR